MKYFVIGCVAYIFNMISPFWVTGILGKNPSDSDMIYCAVTLLSSIVIACTAAIVDAIKKNT